MDISPEGREVSTIARGIKTYDIRFIIRYSGLEILLP